MNCKLPPEIADYLEQVERGKWRVCEEQKAMAAMVRRCFETEDIYVDEKQLASYLRLEKYFPYALFPWEKFLIAIWDCTYWSKDHQDEAIRGTPRWPDILVLLGRGAGKDGFIAFDAMCSVSPFCESQKYDVDICANLEEQAMRPVNDLYEILHESKWAKKLDKFFKHTKEMVKGRKNGGTVRGRTNNPKSRDGMRSGKIIFNEIHQYEDSRNITVFRTGLGKTDNPRSGYFTSNGNLFDGPLDNLIAQSRRILFEEEPDGGLLPFICWITDKKEVDDEANWYKANPSLQYRPSLLLETRKEYQDWIENPEQNPDFLTKRMGLRSQAAEIAVTDYDNIKETMGALPDLRGWSCTAGIDYAELSDWAAVNLHFRQGDRRFDINHAWICTQSKTLHRLKVPWQEWGEKGYLTIVNEVSIHPDLLAGWLMQAARLYNIKALAMDNFRWTLVSASLRQIGFDPETKKNVKLVRPSDIMKVEPVIQECFNRNLFTWGDVPPLRWAVNNTKRVRSSRAAGVDTGNFIYAKIEAKSRKTDPFMALVASMTIEPLLGTGSLPLSELPAVVVV